MGILRNISRERRVRKLPEHPRGVQDLEPTGVRPFCLRTLTKIKILASQTAPCTETEIVARIIWVYSFVGANRWRAPRKRATGRTPGVTPRCGVDAKRQQSLLQA